MYRTDLRPDAGFTLIEMLLAVVLVLTVAVTAAGFMGQGIKLFVKLSAAAQEEDAAVCLAKMTRDLRNATDLKAIPFLREEQRVSFASLEDLSEQDGDPDPSPIAVSYHFDPERSEIERQAVRWQTFERPESTRTETVLKNVRSLVFGYDGEPGQVPWKVTVRIEYQGLFGTRSAEREVLVPAAPAGAAVR